MLRYPFGDSKLQVSMNQVYNELQWSTEILLDVHDVSHDMDF